MESFAEVRAQVAWADVLLLTHDDLACATEHIDLAVYLQEIAPTTPQYKSNSKIGDVAELLSTITSSLRRLPNNNSKISHFFNNLSLHLEMPIPSLLLDNILRTLLNRHPLDLLRIKGIVYMSDRDEAVVIHAAANRLYPLVSLPHRETSDHRGRLVFIFSGDQQLFAEELLTEFAMVIGKNAIRLH